jgi:hypothetical protein
MFGVLDKLAGFFDRRFLIAYWAPVAIALAGLAGVVALDRGIGTMLAALGKLSAMEQAVIAATALVTLIVLAYLLQALTGPMVRLYEGYSLPGWLARGLRRSEELRLQALKRAENEGKSSARYFCFSPHEEHLRPTRLGNALTAAEDYPRQLYQIDSVLWWPRVVTQLSDNVRQQLDAAVVPMIALLNLASAFTTVALGGAFYLYAVNERVGLFLIPLWGGVFLAWLSYRAAVSQAVSYGNVIRVAFDFHRHDVLEKMRIPRPDDLLAERALWKALDTWLFYFTLPWDSGVDPAQHPLIARPFRWIPSAAPLPGDGAAPAPGAVPLAAPGGGQVKTGMPGSANG